MRPEESYRPELRGHGPPSSRQDTKYAIAMMIANMADTVAMAQFPMPIFLCRVMTVSELGQWV